MLFLIKLLPVIIFSMSFHGDNLGLFLGICLFVETHRSFGSIIARFLLHYRGIYVKNMMGGLPEIDSVF